MSLVKTAEETAIIKEAGGVLAKVKEIVAQKIQPGITFAQLDKIAESEIKRLGGRPAFKRVPGYKWTTCINVADGVVHGIPGEYKVRPGDKVSVDIGVYLKGFYTDSAFTVGVPPISPRLEKFLGVGRAAEEHAIKEARAGNRIGHISKAIEDTLRSQGFSPVYMFTGHGVGRELHEEPAIPCFLNGKIEDTPEIKPGMVLAIEAIYAEGHPDIVIGEDSWTARTQDGTMGGLFEETVVITDHDPLVVTK